MSLKPAFQEPLLYHEAFCPSIASTNEWAWEWLEQAPAASLQAALLVAGQQTRGRGTQGRIWQSPAGSGFYGSWAFGLLALQALSSNNSAPFNQEVMGLLPQAITQACIAGLESLWPDLSLTLKPLNDIYANNQEGASCKLGGVLLETRMSGQGQLKALVVGVGINLAPLPQALEQRVKQSSIHQAGPVALSQLLHNNYQGQALLKPMLSHPVMLGRALTPFLQARLASALHKQ